MVHQSAVGVGPKTVLGVDRWYSVRSRSIARNGLFTFSTLGAKYGSASVCTLDVSE